MPECVDYKGWNQSQKRNKHHDTLFKAKSDILLLKKRPKTPVVWPRKFYNSRNLGPRKIYTLPKINNAAKVDVDLQRKYKRKAWDPVLFPTRSETIPSKETSQEEYNNVINNDLQDYVSHIIKKSNPDKPVDEQNADVIKNLSLQLMDRVFNSMANPVPPIPSLAQEPIKKKRFIGNVEERLAQEEEYFKSFAANKSVLDWEFMLSNVIQAKLPPIVIERVKRQMDLITGKKTPAITNMNVTPSPLSDLTISDTELEMQQAIIKATNTVEDSQYQFEERDAPFEEDMRWLMDLTRKDQDTQQKEIDRIQLDYTNHVLDLKPAFF